MLNNKTINADLCVIGGGLSGICAAIAAAREGAKVVLVHERPVLGGNASSEIRMWVCGAVVQGGDNRETGIIEEIMLENLYRNPTKNFYIWDSVLYDFVKREKNITMLLNCTCMDAETEQGEYAFGRSIHIKSIKAYQMTTQTFFTVNAKYYSDCSGDSILAPLTGAEYRLGREGRDEFNEDSHVEKSDKMVMGMSCLIQGRETTKEVKFTPPEWSTKLTDEDVKNRPMSINGIGENYWYLELGGNRDTIHETEEIKDELIPLAIGTWDYLKNSKKYDADNWELEFLGFLPGKRESRRMVGEYIVTQKDVCADTVYDDTVAFGGWPIDDHFPGGYYHKGSPNTNILPPVPYCLPYRALYSKNVDNLFFAGRNISVTHYALSSTRVMATCALLGQAVGTAAAIAAKYDIAPHGVYTEHLQELKDTLMNNDSFLPHFSREISPLCKKIGIKELTDGIDRVNNIYSNETCGIKQKNNTPIEYHFDAPEKINAVHIVFDSDLNRHTLPGVACEKQYGTRCNIALDSPQTHIPTTLCREFVLEADINGNTERLLCTDKNRKRSYHIELGKPVTALRLIPISNWGNDEYTNIFSFDFC